MDAQEQSLDRPLVHLSDAQVIERLVAAAAQAEMIYERDQSRLAKKIKADPEAFGFIISDKTKWDRASDVLIRFNDRAMLAWALRYIAEADGIIEAWWRPKILMIVGSPKIFGFEVIEP